MMSIDNAETVGAQHPHSSSAADVDHFLFYLKALFSKLPKAGGNDHNCLHTSVYALSDGIENPIPRYHDNG